jgi:hypothetical protein
VHYVAFSQVAAIAAVCVQPEADYRPLMTDVVQSKAYVDFVVIKIDNKRQCYQLVSKIKARNLEIDILSGILKSPIGM